MSEVGTYKLIRVWGGGGGFRLQGLGFGLSN